MLENRHLGDGGEKSVSFRKTSTLVKEKNVARRGTKLPSHVIRPHQKCQNIDFQEEFKARCWRIFFVKVYPLMLSNQKNHIRTLKFPLDQYMSPSSSCSSS